MQKGTVKWFNDAKGYGFISPDEKGADLFVHHSAIVMNGFRTLKQGQRVGFEAVQGPKGIQASNVQAEESLSFRPSFRARSPTYSRSAILSARHYSPAALPMGNAR